MRLNHHDAPLEKFNSLIKAFENLTDGRANTFTQAAVQPDDIKEFNATFFNEYHFIDIVYDPHFLLAGMTEPQKDINSINVLGSSVSVLKTNKEGITFERAFMQGFCCTLLGIFISPCIPPLCTMKLIKMVVREEIRLLFIRGSLEPLMLW